MWSPNHPPRAIAIDGPAASGKSSVGQRLARHLGYLYFDTGVMYRAVAFLAHEQHIPPDDAERLGALARTVRLDVLPAPEPPHYAVRADGRDITWALRLPEVEATVSAVSAHPSVRAALTEQQRRVGRQGRVVMVGRDIGTVVMPEAEFKVYLDASPEERARRRYAELQARGEPVSYEAVLAAVRERDHLDSTRETAPLTRAPDAIYVDTTHLSLDEVIAHLLNCIERGSPSPSSGKGGPPS